LPFLHFANVHSNHSDQFCLNIPGCHNQPHLTPISGGGLLKANGQNATQKRPNGTNMEGRFNGDWKWDLIIIVDIIKYSPTD
jgi:hypothetical protein